MITTEKPSKEQLSSLPYQIALYYGRWYFALYAILELLFFCYKSLHLPYPTGNLCSELALLLFLCIIENVRIKLGQKGNLTESTLPVALSLFLSIPSFCGALYLLLWQTYVLRCDVICTAILMTFQSAHALFGIFALFTFSRASRLAVT